MLKLNEKVWECSGKSCFIWISQDKLTRRKPKCPVCNKTMILSSKMAGRVSRPLFFK
ncbi:cold-inducible protein YdjO-related protein [Paenibacillus sp. GCM10027626]|uniref:cold-inducible protein YdjO-related protein n=1 Tax=Paenibacillus sp. GCM10027626 TaxID=3273411 RepID=UPI003625DA24